MKAAVLLLLLLVGVAVEALPLSYGIQCQTIIVRGSNGTQGEIGPPGPEGPPGPVGPIGPSGINGVVDHVVFGEVGKGGLPGQYYGVLSTRVYRPMNKVLSRVTPSWFTLNSGYDRFGLAGGGTYHITVTALQQSNANLGSLQIRLTTVDPLTGLDTAELASSWTTAGTANGLTMKVDLETEIDTLADTFYRIRNVASQTTGYLGTAALAALTSTEVYLSVRVQRLNTPATQTFTISDTAVPSPFTSVGLASTTATTVAGVAVPFTTRSSAFHFRSQQVAGTLVTGTRLWATIAGSYHVSACRHATGVATSVFFWYRINGVEAAGSTSQTTLVAAGDISNACASYLVSLQEGDYLEVVASSTAVLNLVTNVLVPVAPSVAVVAYKSEFYGSISSTVNLAITTAAAAVVFPAGSMPGVSADRTTVSFTGFALAIVRLTIAALSTGNTIQMWAGGRAAQWISTGASDVRQVSIVQLVETSVSVFVRSTAASNTVHGAVAGTRPASFGAVLSLLPLSSVYFEAFSSATQTITTTGAAVAFATTLVNTGSVAGTSTFTVSATGAWFVYALLQVQPGRANNVCDMYLRKGLQGAAAVVLELSGATLLPNSATATAMLTRTWIVNLNAGDTIETFVRCSGTLGSLVSVAAAGPVPLIPSARIVMTLVSTDKPHSQVAATGPAW